MEIMAYLAHTMTMIATAHSSNHIGSVVRSAVAHNTDTLLEENEEKRNETKQNGIGIN